MRVEPDYGQCLTETTFWPGGYKRYALPPTGYLAAITIEPVILLPTGSDVNWRAEFEVTDVNDVALHEVIRWQYPLSKCGVMFREPIPNMNTACPYWLHRLYPEKCPDLKVTTVSLMIGRDAA